MNETTASERERFEAWARAKTTLSLTRHPEEAEEYFRASTDGAWIAWQARAALPAPADQVLVPKRLTRAMREVIDEEGWTWEDLLAAAEAITEAEHTELQAAHGASDNSEQDQPKV